MSEKFIVTITREFGSMGRPVARRLSELLNVEFYDRDIVEETARQMELPLSVVSKNEENFLLKSRMRFFVYNPRLSENWRQKSPV